MKNGKPRPKRTQRTYSDRERAETLTALDANGGNVKRTSRDTGVPCGTIRGWRDHPPNADVVELRERFGTNLAAAFEAMSWKLLERVNAETSEIPTGRLMTDAAIATDKARLLRGLPTEISEQRDANLEGLTTDELLRKRDELKRTLDARGDAGGSRSRTGEARA